jgi:hypothetical protein
VINARNAMRQLKSLHNLDINGLVDRDHRSDDEIEALRAIGLRVAEVAEVENLFCRPSVILEVAKHLHKPSPTDELKKAQTRVLSELKKSVDTQIASRALASIQYKVSGFGPKASTATALTVQTDLTTHFASIDVTQVFKEAETLFNDIIARDDYEAALRFYNCKGNVASVASVLGLPKKIYCEVVNGLASNQQGALVSDLRSQIL